MEFDGRKRWLFVLVAVASVLFVLSRFVEVTSGDLRPKGGAADLYGLRFRDDTNVLFILVDTLRADRLGCYGYERDTSPTLDYLAETGVLFGNHLAQSSWTKCSMASLWTSLEPVRSGVTRFDHALPADALMPAEVFAEAGFRTAGIWRNGWLAPNFGFGQGFEVYERPRPAPVPLAIRRDNPHVNLAGTDHDVVDNALEFLRAHGHERFFLYLHLMDVHQYVYDESSARFGSSYSDVYDNSILFTDTVLARLLTHFADSGLLEKTLVVVTSDHGEAFSERGIEGHAKHVYRESTEIPLIVSLPFRLEEGIRVDLRSRNIDVWPTIFDLLGLEPDEGIDGRSLVPAMLTALTDGDGAKDEEAPPAFAFLDRTWGQASRPSKPAIAVVERSLRYVYDLDPSTGALQEHLFDRAGDPEERRDMLRATSPGKPDGFDSEESYAEVADRLRDVAEAYLEDAPPPPWGEGDYSVEIDEMELNQLRALGYDLP
ncbi:MAG: sulfatase [Myxococcota bacterium]